MQRVEAENEIAADLPQQVIRSQQSQVTFNFQSKNNWHMLTSFAKTNGTAKNFWISIFMADKIRFEYNKVKPTIAFEITSKY